MGIWDVITIVGVFGVFLYGLIMLCKSLKTHGSVKSFVKKYFQEQIVDGSVDIALGMIKKDILTSARLVKNMLENANPAFKKKDMKLINRICETSSKIETIHKSVVPFLIKISRTERDQDGFKKSINYLYIENKLEAIGTIINKSLMTMAKKMAVLDLSFSEQSSKELAELHEKVVLNVNKMIAALKEENIELAKEIIENYSDIDEKKYQHLYIERLNERVEDSLETSGIHLDVINYYARINNDIAYIAKRIIWMVKKVPQTMHNCQALQSFAGGVR
ncbi:MAG: hypothetical protein FWC36_02050 [Spirochaetes bacterium]|nr:hypothetical protein [Spirochaetota bacterium]